MNSKANKYKHRSPHFPTRAFEDKREKIIDKQHEDEMSEDVFANENEKLNVKCACCAELWDVVEYKSCPKCCSPYPVNLDNVFNAWKEKQSTDPCILIDWEHERKHYKSVIRYLEDKL